MKYIVATMLQAMIELDSNVELGSNVLRTFTSLMTCVQR